MRTLLLLFIALCPRPAFAACDLSLSEFGGAAVAVRRALESDDVETARRTVDDVQSRVECLTFAPARQAWASWQFLVAVTRFAEGKTREAEVHLSYAVHLDPYLDRAWLGSGHALRSAEVQPPSSTDGVPPGMSRGLSTRTRLFVDGQVATELPADGGPHLVQLNDGLWWDTRLVTGDASAAGTDLAADVRSLWVPRRPPRPVDVWLDAGVITGFEAAGFDDEAWGFSHAHTAQLQLEIALDERLTLWAQGTLGSSQFGVMRGQRVTDLYRPSHLVGLVSIRRRPRWAQSFQLGGGVCQDATFRSYQYGGRERQATQHVLAFARFVRGRERRADVAAGAGIGVRGGSALFAVAGVRPTRGTLRYRIGVAAHFRTYLLENRVTNQTIFEHNTSVGLQLDLNLVDTRLNDDDRTPRSRVGRSSRRTPAL